MLFSESQEIELTKEIIEKINNVFNRYGEVKSDASPDLEIIRKEISHARKAIQENFNRALTMYGQSDLLDDIRETIIDDQRVLAVKSGFKKRIPPNAWRFQNGLHYLYTTGKCCETPVPSS